jgi:hypothetical protein
VVLIHPDTKLEQLENVGKKLQVKIRTLKPTRSRPLGEKHRKTSPLPHLVATNILYDQHSFQRYDIYLKFGAEKHIMTLNPN